MLTKPNTPINIATTTKVYGRRSASLTIHMTAHSELEYWVARAEASHSNVNTLCRHPQTPMQTKYPWVGSQNEQRHSDHNHRTGESHRGARQSHQLHVLKNWSLRPESYHGEVSLLCC